MIKFKESFFSIFPIYALILILNLTPLIDFSFYEVITLTCSTILLIIGMSLFNLGADFAMMPMGKSVGVSITKQGKLWVLLLVCFGLGLLVTVAEPDLVVLANQTKAIFDKTTLIFAIGLGVGVFLLISILKIVFKVELAKLLCYFYMILFALSSFIIASGNENIIGLAFDSGGVTTGPITVPFIMALGIGVSSVLSKKSEKDASFGLIAMCSVGPIIMVLILSIFTKGNLVYELSDYGISNNFLKSFFYNLLITMKDVAISLGMIVLFFLICNFIWLKISRKKMLRLGIGIIYSFLGLSIFLAAVTTGFLPIGYELGSMIATKAKYLLIPLGFIIGVLTVLAEPAIHVLNKQVEEITGGMVKKRSMLIALSIGVGISLTLSMIRVIVGFNVLVYLIPGYVLCLGLSFFVPKMYSAIAFDSGGVASGPLTSSFILPMAIGASLAVSGSDKIMINAFGIVSMVAMTPLITIQLLGLFAIIKDKIYTKRMVKYIRKQEDEEIIEFL